MSDIRKKFKTCLLETMDYIHSICEEHSLCYFIMFGTLLGSARHKGFIPWDDDIDIVMPRDDYNKFVKILTDCDSDFFIVTHELNRKYYLPFAKVCNKKIVLYEHVSRPIKLGAYIDVFPLDYCEDSFKESLSLVRKLFIKQRQLTIKNTRIDSERPLWKNALLILLKLLLLFRTRHSLIKYINKESTKNASKPKKYVSCLCFVVYKEKALFESDMFSETVLVEFEGRKYRAPKHYVSILSQIYGNYLKLPPAEKRVTHHGFDLYFNDDRID